MSRSFPATSGEQDSEEVAALVPEEKGDHAAAASAGPPRPSLSAVLRTRGVVASTMAGLVFLALLVGFGRWIKLEHVSITSGYVLFSSVFHAAQIF